METLWHAGLSNAAWAVALAVPAALVGRWGRRPALAHGLWVLVLVKLVTPPAWSIPLPSFVHTAAPDGGQILTRTDLPEVTPAPAQPADEPSSPVTEDTPEGANDRNPPGPAEPDRTAHLAWAAVLVPLWLTGSALWFLLAGWRVAHFRKLLRCARPAPAALREQVRQLAQGLGLTHLPGVWLVPDAVSPMLWAILGRPRLVLPADLWERLADDQRAALLVHELAHLRRRDHWVRLLELAATGLYWWHPLVWWARRAIERAEEECCDAWVVWALPRAARAYAEALLETVDFLSEVRCPLPPAVSGIGHVPFLRRRLAMILRGTCTRKLSRPGLWLLIGLGALVLPLLPGLGADQVATAAPDDPLGVVSGGGEPAEPPTPARTAGGSKPGVEHPPDRPASVSGVRAPTLQPRTEDLQNARDEVELLEVQLEGKRAELKEGQTRLTLAARQLDKLQKLYDKGTVSEGTLAKARDDVDLTKAQLQSKQVQVKEAEVRLNQAKRRLARMQAPSSREVGAAPLPTRARSAADANGFAARKERLQGMMAEYRKLLKEKQATPGEAKDIEAFLQRLRAEVKMLENEMKTLGGGHGARTSSETKPSLDNLKLRKDLEQAVRELELSKTKALQERLRAEVERARAQEAEAKARAEAAAREEAATLEKQRADQPRIPAAAPPQPRTRDASPKLKSVEDRLDALAREMEALRKDIRDLAARPERAPGGKPPTTPAPARP